ncbi:MAG: DsbA family protein [Bacteroidetes bacterium]|nr:DsbA family protein [Bacteroidota bacterium]
MVLKIQKNRRLWIFIVSTIIFIGAVVLFLMPEESDERKPENILFENELDIVYGKDSTDITVFMFSSYNCLFCRKFFRDVFPDVDKEYIQTGKVKLVVKPVAIEKSGPVVNSIKLAVCINRFGDFTKLYELLLTEPKVVYTDKFESVTNELIQKNEFVAECMLTDMAEKYIMRNYIDFNRLKCTGTPTFVINNKIYKGYKTYDEFQKIIEKERIYALH